MATFDELVNQIDNNLDNQRDRGTAFEKMVVAYLKNEPTYKQKFSDVWMLNEVPSEYHISKRDTGVDIVAKDYAGNLTAVQAKYYKGKVGKDTINSFVAEAGKDYYAAGMLVSSTDEWNRNAEAALENNTKPFTRIGLSQLRHADVDWKKFSFAKENDLSQKVQKKLRGYQKTAINNSVTYFKDHDRGKLIMAPGTGKTFTSLKIAEALMKDQKKHQFYVLYLVPSIQLLTQTLFNWNNDVSDDIHMTSFSVVSDNKANKKKGKDDDTLGAKDVGFEPTTNVEELVSNFKYAKKIDTGNEMTVVFSTYQSIDVIHKAQDQGIPEFDLIIADEAHRTTGATKLGEDSAFTEVHSNKNVKGELRLYQTATPKIYDANAKRKAEENSIVVSSMDDEERYGKEIFRFSFEDAVSQGYLTDYKVTVLAVSESYINKDMQRVMAADNQLKVDDIGKIIGVWNAMVKRNGITGEITGAPMKRAIAFTDTIKHSKTISEEFETVVNEYLDAQSTDSFQVDVHHVDGKLNALQKEEQIDWLADDSVEDNHARVLSNVRFLTEGIDVPNLDAIIFFSPKKSQVDIVQAVGRIMRLAEGKEYGYIILPIVVADGVDPRDALNNDKQYKQVWQVLNALRSTDERFDAEVNKLDLNKKKDGKINFIGVDSSPDADVTEANGLEVEQNKKPAQLELPLQWREMRNAFYGKVVQKVGDRRYLEDWSTDVSNIAHMYIRRISDLIESNQGAKLAFNKFINSLHHNINDSIDQDKAIEMLAQHLITEPIFDELFGEYSFVKNNVVSKSLNDVISTFKAFGFEKEQKQLEPLYESIKLRASGIDNAAAKQKIIVTLYENFFKKGFEKTTDAMGIVFTPIEVVDFIIHSVDDALQKYFGKTLADKGVHILDPFTGTGTFITRTLQYLKQQMDEGKITFDDLLRKYLHELHANEIVLLSYYIAAINIEAVFDEVNGPDKGYQPFEGIVLTDTFESTEQQQGTLNDDIFGTNNKRLKKQQETPITVIISNPPYSGRQKNENDNNENIKYPLLDKEIERDYIEGSSATAKHAVYDSYIRAIKWATDRIKNNGVVGFITSSSYIDGRSLDGLRKRLNSEYNHIYILNLKGSIRGKVGIDAKKEGQNIFNILTGVAIIILVKDGSSTHEIKYCEVPDYASKKEKLQMLEANYSFENLSTENIIPNNKGDWINQTQNIEKYALLFDNKNVSNGIFLNKEIGINTKRDKWVYGYSANEVLMNLNRMIQNYNREVNNLKKKPNYQETQDNHLISWSDELKRKYKKGILLSFKGKDALRKVLFRPFTKKYLYLDKEVLARPGDWNDFEDGNSFLILPGKSNRRSFSTLVANIPIDQNIMDAGAQTFWQPKKNNLLIKNSEINLKLLDNLDLNEKEILPYVYSLLNSVEYKKKFYGNLKKGYQPIFKVKSKEKYIEIGNKLIDLHLNYEKVPVYDKVQIVCKGKINYKVKQMKFAKKRNADGKSENDLSTIIYNDSITISGIPDKAYQYVVNGRSAIEWIMDQYRVKTDKKSGITDDPNDFSDDPKYIFNLLLRIINVSLKTIDLINQLPKLEVENDD